MDTSSPTCENLECPHCGGSIKTVHPYYTVEDRSMELHSIHSIWIWTPGTILLFIWWPLGILGLLLAWLFLGKKSKSELLYKCTKCNTKLSFESVTMKENEQPIKARNDD